MISKTATTLAILAGLAQVHPAAAQIDMSKELDRLHDAATALAASAPDFRAGLEDVARMHGAVAALRAGDDPKRASCMLDQASFLASAGQLDAAHGMAARAAQAAEADGEVGQAADAWIATMMLARQAGDFEAAELARQHAEWLATLERMSPTESAAVAARLYGERWRLGALPPGDAQN